MYIVLIETHIHTLTWFGPNSHEFRALFQFLELGPSCANKACCLVWFFLHLCVTWCSVPMSPFKRAAMKGGNSKGKEHVIDVDDLSPRLKRNMSSSGIYDPNNFRTYTAFQTHENISETPNFYLKGVLISHLYLTLTSLNGLPQKIGTTFSPHLMIPMRIWWKNSMLMQ